MNDRVRKLEASVDFAEEMLVAEIQSLLEEILEEKGFSRADLAKKMGVTKARVTQIFSDTQNFTVRLIARAFHALGERVIVGHCPASAVETKAANKRCEYAQQYTVDQPSSYELVGGVPRDWHHYEGAVYVADWPEAYDVADALVSYIETQMIDPPQASKGDNLRSETPKAVAEWARQSNVLPFRKEAVRA